jgi:hypothetical protein
MNTITPEMINEWRRLEREATAGPWAVRPDEFDDWGCVRSLAGDTHWMVASARGGDRRENHDQCRTNGTDPYAHNADIIVAMRNTFPALLDEVERLTGERDLAITAIGDTARKLEGDVQYWQRKCERLTRERDAAEAALAEHAPGYTLDDVAQAVDAIMPPELAASWQAIVAPRVIIDGQPVSYEELAALEAAAQVAPPQTDDVDGLNPERLAAWKVAAANSLSAHQARAVLMGVPMPDHTKEKTDGA